MKKMENGQNKRPISILHLFARVQSGKRFLWKENPARCDVEWCFSTSISSKSKVIARLDMVVACWFFFWAAHLPWFSQPVAFAPIPVLQTWTQWAWHQVPVAFGMILGSCVVWSSFLRVLDTGFQLSFLSLLILGAAWNRKWNGADPGSWDVTWRILHRCCYHRESVQERTGLKEHSWDRLSPTC